ncbi:hypothetical protein F4809DRAFT_611288 [Biscogniauxia mediterranea]|nr:hypothetical protein F4809DRAFT_611288 [Biscogniauxia mediterranea]
MSAVKWILEYSYSSLLLVLSTGIPDGCARHLPLPALPSLFLPPFYSLLLALRSIEKKEGATGVWLRYIEQMLNANPKRLNRERGYVCVSSTLHLERSYLDHLIEAIK